MLVEAKNVTVTEWGSRQFQQFAAANAHRFLPMSPRAGSKQGRHKLH